MWLEQAVLNAQRKTYKAQSVVFGKPNLRKGSTQKDYGTPLWLLPKISSRESVRQKISQERIVNSKWCILSEDQQSLFHCVKHQKNEGVTVREILCSLSQNAPQWTRMKVSAPGKSWGRETMRNKGKKEWSCGSHRETLMGEICYAI